MSLEQLASSAGRVAADVGRNADRPAFSEVLARRQRRALFGGWAAAAVTIIVGATLILSASDTPARETAATSTTTSRSLATTTTVVDRESCPITIAGPSSFSPPSEAPSGPPPSYQTRWYGTPALWAMIREGGEVWEGLPADEDGLTQKTFWWSVDYPSSIEEPEIEVTADDINGSAPSVKADRVTGGGHPELGIFMIAGLEIPHEGCWRITAELGDASLSYVAWVGEQ